MNNKIYAREVVTYKKLFGKTPKFSISSGKKFIEIPNEDDLLFLKLKYPMLIGKKYEGNLYYWEGYYNGDIFNAG